jgi:hypothetical protein
MKITVTQKFCPSRVQYHCSDAPSEEKSDDSKDIFYEELRQYFDLFSKCHILFLIGYFNSKLGKDYIFKPKMGKICLH